MARLGGGVNGARPALGRTRHGVGGRGAGGRMGRPEPKRAVAAGTAPSCVGFGRRRRGRGGRGGFASQAVTEGEEKQRAGSNGRERIGGMRSRWTVWHQSGVLALARTGSRAGKPDHR